MKYPEKALIFFLLNIKHILFPSNLQKQTYYLLKMQVILALKAHEFFKQICRSVLFERDTLSEIKKNR